MGMGMSMGMGMRHGRMGEVSQPNFERMGMGVPAPPFQLKIGKDRRGWPLT